MTKRPTDADAHVTPEDARPKAAESRPSNALLVVAKRPAPGFTKTRLSPPLTPEQAALLYECFLLDTLAIMRQVANVQPIIAYLPAEEGAYFRDLAPDFELIAQEGDDLGARLDNALTHCLVQGYSSAVIMNSDGPTLPPSHLASAFDALDAGADVVLGPCTDGGYYLIGLKQPAPRLLREVRMSTPNVTADTLSLATQESLRVAQLPRWFDVDEVDDLIHLCREIAAAPSCVAVHTRSLLAENSAFAPYLVPARQ
jgi:uncharacterized protein